MDTLDLHRFIEAQAPVIEQVRRELQAGRQQAHALDVVYLLQLRGPAIARWHGISALPGKGKRMKLLTR